MKRGLRQFILSIFLSFSTLAISSCGPSSSSKEESRDGYTFILPNGSTIFIPTDKDSSSGGRSSSPKEESTSSVTSYDPKKFYHLSHDAFPGTTILRYNNMYYAAFHLADYSLRDDCAKMAEQFGGRLYCPKSLETDRALSAHLLDYKIISGQKMYIGVTKSGSDYYDFHGQKLGFNNQGGWSAGGPVIAYGTWHRSNDPQTKYFNWFDEPEGRRAYWFLMEWDSYDNIGVPNYENYMRMITDQEGFFKTDYNPRAHIEIGADFEIDELSYIDNFNYKVDGKGHTITVRHKDLTSSDSTYLINNLSGSISNVNFEISASSSQELNGIAGIANTVSGSLHDVTVSGLIYAPRSSSVGGVCNQVTGELYNVTSRVTVVGRDFVGGIIGRNEGKGRLDSLHNEKDVTGHDNVGGVIGYLSRNKGAATDEINSLTNQGEIKGENYVGGIAGYFADNDAALAGNNWRDDAIVTGTSYVGGLIGFGDTPKSTASYLDNPSNSGTIHAKGDHIGGIAGELKNISLNHASNNDTTINITGSSLDDSGDKLSYAGGLVGAGYQISDSENSADIQADGDYVGGLAGYLYGDAHNCTNYGNVTSKGRYVGGVFGYGHGTLSLDTLANYGVIYSEGPNVGGIAGALIGRVDSEVTIKIYQNSNYGDVRSSGSQVGGIVGLIDFPASKGAHLLVEECENSANITSTTSYVAGIIGKATINGAKTDSEIKNSVNGGSITGEDHVAGIIAYAYNINNFIELSNIGAVTGTKYVAGIIAESLSDHYGSDYDVTYSSLTNTATITGEDYVSGIVAKFNYYCTNKGKARFKSAHLVNNGKIILVTDEGHKAALIVEGSCTNTGGFVTDYTNADEEAEEFGTLTNIEDKG